MKLLNRIAHSQGNPERATAALNLITHQSLGQSRQARVHLETDRLFARFEQADHIASSLELRRRILADVSARLYQVKN